MFFTLAENLETHTLRHMNKVNYQAKLDKIIAGNQAAGITPTLLLHACCAPCSSYVLEYLSQYFRITVYYFNPNIYPEKEYLYRKSELSRLISEMRFTNPVSVADCDYDSSDFFGAVKGLEHCPEGGERCFECYRLRLESTARTAKELGSDFFASTLSISPLKNAQKLNEIGECLAGKHSVKWLPNDFKKREGYKRSIILSQEHSLYRQNYCGCVFSKNSNDDPDGTV